MKIFTSEDFELLAESCRRARETKGIARFDSRFLTVMALYADKIAIGLTLGGVDVKPLVTKLWQSAEKVSDGALASMHAKYQDKSVWNLDARAKPKGDNLEA